MSRCGSDRRAAGTVTALLVLVVSACSTRTTDVHECQSNTTCRDTFGLGYVCNAGFCEAAQGQSRCASTFPEDLLSRDIANTVVVGNLMDRSLSTHRARERAARLAIKTANEQGGIEERELGIVFCTIEEDAEFDQLTRQQAALATSRYLVDTLGVPAIIGPASSGDTQAVFLELAGTDTLVISPSATSPALSALDPVEGSDEVPGLLWRTAPPDSLQGAAISFDMGEPGSERAAAASDVAVIAESGPYGDELANVFMARFQADYAGDAELLTYDSATTLNDRIVDAALGDYDEVLFISSQTADVISFMDAAATLPGYAAKGIFLTDAAANSDLLEDANPARFGQVRGTRQAPRDEANEPVYASFIAGYSTEYGEDARAFSFTANAHDAAWLIAYGIAWAHYHEPEITGTTIARGLRRMSSGIRIELRGGEWNKGLRELREGRSIDVSGASGELNYDPITEETTSNIEIWKIDSGAIAGVYTWVP